MLPTNIKMAKMGVLYNEECTDEPLLAFSTNSSHEQRMCFIMQASLHGGYTDCIYFVNRCNTCFLSLSTFAFLYLCLPSKTSELAAGEWLGRESRPGRAYWSSTDVPGARRQCRTPRQNKRPWTLLQFTETFSNNWKYTYKDAISSATCKVGELCFMLSKYG